MDDEEITAADLLTWDGDSRVLDAEAVAEALNRLLARIRVLERESGHAARREPGGVRMEENVIQCCEEGVKIGIHNPWACTPSEPCSKCRHIMDKHWRDD